MFDPPRQPTVSGLGATIRASAAATPSAFRRRAAFALWHAGARRCRAVVPAATLLALALLTGCKEEKHNAAPAAASLTDRVRAATEQAIGAGAAPAPRFRGVQVYQQALPLRLAVCGQLAPFAANPGLFVPFVSIVTTPMNPDEPAPHYQFEHHIGTTTAEASRVYAAIVTYCFDQGGPAPPGPYRSVMAPPPLPDSIPDLSSGAAPVTPAKPAPAIASAPRLQAPASPAAASLPAVDPVPAGSVTMRQNANLHADPHGASVRVVPQGTVMRVFAQAPGGWYQVGDTAPWGWVHDSMLERHQTPASSMAR